MVSRSDRAGETEKADWNPIIFAVQVQWVRRWFFGQAAAVYSAALLLEWRQFICFLPDTNNETDDGAGVSQNDMWLSKNGFGNF